MNKVFNWEQEVKSEWNTKASVWSERSVRMWDDGSRKDIIPFFKQHLKKESSLLDVGCGDGYGSYKLKQAGHHVVGVDISEEMIHIANNKIHNQGISFIQGDIGDLPFEDNHFDGIMSINVLEWTKVPSLALAELKRVLKKDGLLCIGILGPTAGPRDYSYQRLYGKDTIINTMMPWEFQRLAREAEFDYIEGFGVNKKEIKEQHTHDLPEQLKQALTFMWVFMLQKR